MGPRCRHSDALEHARLANSSPYEILCALVTTLVTCSECGTEEDPTEWKIGPPLTLYRRTFEVAFEFNGGPDLCRASDEIIEAKLRAELQGVLEELEGVAGTAFVMKKYAGP